MKASRAQGRIMNALEELAAAYTAIAEELDEIKAALTELAEAGEDEGDEDEG